MTPEQKIENFAKGWVAKAVRHEPVEKLTGRLRVQITLTLVFCAMFTAIFFVGLESLLGHKVTLMYVVLGCLPLVMGFSAFQMWRFINLRKALASDIGVAS